MDSYTTRITCIEDKPAVEELLKASYPVLMAPAYDPAVLAPTLELITRANPTLLTSGNYYLAETTGGAVVGCGGWTPEAPAGTDPATGGIGHLRHFGTHPAWTGRGIGKAIFEHCREAAREAGIEVFEVYSSLNGEGFYSALGFKAVRRVSVRVRDEIEFPSMLMRRKL